ncbi:TetR/AcrR family transcriptional regulator [Hymenobacter mucosus]|uniref:Transcriptional regulator, TetR family n=1 Tax=Hymenobacter mucosus TaxID=1411120 RepID=A0A239AKH5_9BACT|nr:TetR/AcrR family transcriptional regulator [Hymenobacter mucosus]SNR95881.1 transcriptional regulator, TetR family [Hymenobacter mucosus]
MSASQTQHRIIEAAILVFNEDYSAPLEHVAEQADVTRRTLHRYFTGREELLASCAQEMRRSCQQAMLQALNSSAEPRKQLEYMLYAGVDCGAKYALFNKLHSRPEHHHTPLNADCAAYDSVCSRFRNVITQLQEQGAISLHLTTAWVMALFNGVVVATVNAATAGAVAPNSLKEFAWFSFSKGIGV